MPEGGRPIAQAYAGHQFGHFTSLGDGRAILLGEQITPSGGRVDIQLKGAGRTPFSRRGDGRAALGPMLREYIISEAMHALGIPTTRSLAVVTTGEPVYRETVLDGAVLTRVAASHIRVGTMQWAAAHDDRTALRALADYTRARHYPELADSPEPHVALFDAILERQARLIARWQLVGFIHGVMNTDNMALSGETIDYGPCAFMDSVRSRHGVQLHRPRRPLRLRQPAVDRAVEPGPARRGDVAAVRSRTAIAPWSVPRRRSTASRTCSSSTGSTACERSLDCSRRKTATRRSSTTCSPGCSGGPPTSRTPSAPLDQSRAPGRRSRGRRSRTRGVASPVGGAPCAAAAVAGRGRDLMRRHNPAFIPRNHKVEEALEAATNADDYSVMAAAARRAGDTLRPRPRPAHVQRASVRRAALPHVLRHLAQPRRPGCTVPPGHSFWSV